MKEMIAVIGAGGKTTLTHRLAEQYRSEGKKVLLTTTTHMLVETDTDLSCDAAQIVWQLQASGYCMAGQLCSDKSAIGDNVSAEMETCESRPAKISGLPQDVWNAAVSAADVVLVEADGSKHYSLKYPAEYEPVLPKETTKVILVEGLWDLGKPISEVVFRYDLMAKIREIDGTAPVNMAFLKKVLEPAFRQRLEAAGFTGEMQILYTVKENGELTFLTENEALKRYEK